MPGESARPHRHTPNALRVMLEDGGDTYTVVDGKECLMQRGDIVLTPAQTWHSHFHRGTGPSIWFDALDSGLSALFDAAFFEPSSRLGDFPPTMSDSHFVSMGLSPVLPAGVAASYSPYFRFPWGDTLAALGAAPAQDDGSVWLRLVNPAGGQMAMAPMDSFAVKLSRTPTRARRTTASGMCVVLRGNGVSRVGDRDLNWAENDVFTLPHWSWITHRSVSDDAIIFVFTDRGALDALGFLKEELA